MTLALACPAALTDSLQRIGAVDPSAVERLRVELDEDVASRWGPRVVDLFRTVADAVNQVGVAG